MQDFLINIYEYMLKYYGKQHWWPGDYILEIMVGALLTQNTSWRGVEKAIKNLKQEGMLDMDSIINNDRVLELIRSSGFYNIKHKRLKNMILNIKNTFGDNLESLKLVNPKVMREFFLSLNGIGKETADSILLYGLEHPFFVVDAYTKRLFERLGVFKENDYDVIQRFFHTHLPVSTQLFNEYHALIVTHSKNICKKRPECKKCFLIEYCNYGKNR